MKAYVRVTMSTDGKTPQRELMFDGRKVGDLSFFEALELVLNISSGFRFEKEFASQLPLPRRRLDDQ